MDLHKYFECVSLYFLTKIKLKVTQSFLRDYVGLKGYLSQKGIPNIHSHSIRNVSLCTHASKLGGGSKNYTTSRKSSLIKSWNTLNCWLYRKCMPSYYAVAAVMFPGIIYDRQTCQYWRLLGSGYCCPPEYLLRSLACAVNFPWECGLNQFPTLHSRKTIRGSFTFWIVAPGGQVNSAICWHF